MLRPPSWLGLFGAHAINTGFASNFIIKSAVTGLYADFGHILIFKVFLAIFLMKILVDCIDCVTFQLLVTFGGFESAADQSSKKIQDFQKRHMIGYGEQANHDL
ncbi:hypothetical protein JTB14_024853 [Gonioctena quinquepunctata]|nr:hypothetical protein JTB14_024853 [Gonioctena quinquepunctata]